MGKAMLLIEFRIELVNKEEGKEDEDKRRTAQYHQEIRSFLCYWNPPPKTEGRTGTARLYTLL